MQQQPDDPRIENTDVLWRPFRTLTTKGGVQRPSSSEFKHDDGNNDHSGEFSVDVARFTSMEQVFARRSADYKYIAEFPAGLPRSFDIEIEGERRPERYTVYLWDDGTNNPAHAHVHPPAVLVVRGKAMDRYAKIMAQRATFISRPEK